MNRKTMTILYVGLIIAVVLFLIFLVFWLRSESSNCVKNPINYFKDKNPQITCQCSKDGVRIDELSDPIKIDFKPNNKNE